MQNKLLIPTDDMIFVFGSNRSGIHGAGAARYAHLNKGAVMYQGEGHFGMSYALPTKGVNISFIPINEVDTHVKKFIKYAKDKQELKFQVTAMGTGLAGFTHLTMSHLFLDAPKNCYFDTLWEQYLGSNFKYWGTF